jgi:RNA polymerase sigma-70 factor (sigma-E family)
MEWLRAGGAQREFDTFARHCTHQLLRTAYLMTWDRPEAEDLVQETLLRVARRWPRVRAMDHRAAYARRILVNLVIDGAGHRARRNSELELTADALLAGRTDTRAEQALQSVDTQAGLLAALADLPRHQRVIVVLRYWEDLAEADVAAILGCSRGTVKSTASRGLARLRQALQAEQPQQPAGTQAPR